MSISLPTSVTGGAQTGFTSPTYTAVAGTYPGYNGRQNYVTALGGTQTGVRVHSATDPFTFASYVPANIKAVPQAVNGVYGLIPVNVYGVNIRKGLLPAASAPGQIGMIDIKCRLPAGSDSYDSANVRAMLSLAVGLLNNISAGLGDTLVSGQL